MLFTVSPREIYHVISCCLFAHTPNINCKLINPKISDWAHMLKIAKGEAVGDRQYLVPFVWLRLSPWLQFTWFQLRYLIRTNSFFFLQIFTFFASSLGFLIILSTSRCVFSICQIRKKKKNRSAKTWKRKFPGDSSSFSIDKKSNFDYSLSAKFGVYWWIYISWLIKIRKYDIYIFITK